jgi:hypothetical protein
MPDPGTEPARFDMDHSGRAVAERVDIGKAAIDPFPVVSQSDSRVNEHNDLSPATMSRSRSQLPSTHVCALRNVCHHFHASACPRCVPAPGIGRSAVDEVELGRRMTATGRRPSSTEGSLRPKASGKRGCPTIPRRLLQRRFHAIWS